MKISNFQIGAISSIISPSRRSRRSDSRCRSRSRDGRSSRGRKRSRSHSRYRKFRKDSEDSSGSRSGSAVVSMVPRSRVRKIRKWMNDGIESKEATTLRVSYMPAFEGAFELMAPNLDQSMVR